jgi:hypothetical protein
LLVLFPNSFRVDCRHSFGLPLVRYGQILSAFPLSKKDLEYFQGLRETLVFSDEGAIRTLSLTQLSTENIESWFDLSAFQVLETTTLGEVKTKPVIVERVEEVNLRENLKTFPRPMKNWSKSYMF